MFPSDSLLYKLEHLYNKESEGNIVYNDPDIHVEWGVDNPILSEKDKIGPTLREFVTPF